MNAISAGIAVWKIFCPIGQLTALSLSCSHGTSSLGRGLEVSCGLVAEVSLLGLNDLDLLAGVEAFVLEAIEGGRAPVLLSIVQA